MKRRRALLLSLTIVLALCVACGFWLHRERQQYALNRQLIAALIHNDTKTALALVNVGADPNTRYAPNPAPSLQSLFNQFLHHISPVSNERATAFQCACGARPTEYTVLILSEDLRLLRAMLAHGAKIHERMTDGQTALHVAVLTERLDTVELLLQHGANINAQDNEGTTPLMLAASFGKTQEVRLLLAHGANPNAQDKYGYTALSVALFSLNAKDQIPDLLAHGAAPNLPDKRGRTPLQIAQRAERPDLVRLLQQHGAK